MRHYPLRYDHPRRRDGWTRTFHIARELVLYRDARATVLPYTYGRHLEIEVRAPASTTFIEHIKSRVRDESIYRCRVCGSANGVMRLWPSQPWYLVVMCDVCDDIGP